MDDASIRHRISDLVEREHHLREAMVEGRISEGVEHAELSALEVELDQCWDLLRHRAARRHAGLDPEEAQPRPAEQVERYLQ
jgi:hypothetical protein